MSATSPDFDVQEQLARIRRAQEESDKFASEQKKLTAETSKLSAEMFKLWAEEMKLNAEAAKLRRDRLLAPVVLVASVAGAVIAAGVGLLAKVH